MEDANKIGMMRTKDGYGKRREGSCGKFIECELWSPSDSRNWLRFEFEMEDWDSQCGGAQFRYDTIRLPSPHPGKVNATTARYIYIMDWKIWSLSWKSQCQNFICCQCDFEKKFHCVQKGQSSPCKIEMIEFSPSFSFLNQLPLGFSLSRLGFSWHRFGATWEQRVGQMDCSKTLLLSIPLFVFQTEQFLVSISLFVFQTEQLSEDGAQVSGLYIWWDDPQRGRQMRLKFVF